MDAQMSRFFMAYLTANDDQSYFADFLNFRNMAKRNPGVERIELFIAVSEVNPWSANDAAALNGLVELAERSSWLKVRRVIRKGNIGRDFSSAEACLRSMADNISDDDYVLIRNRSAYGPSRSGWYKDFIEQYQRHPNTGLVGSTINLRDHPLRPSEGSPTHVQTYAYLSQWRSLVGLMDAYPASRCVDRLQLIVEGEIGLSQRILSQGLGISCLLWPDQLFHADSPTPSHLPKSDTKSSRPARALSLCYKYSRYRRRLMDLPARLEWALYLHQNSRAELRDSAPMRVTDYD